MAQLQRLAVQQNRITLAQARHDTRDWVQERRARTRQLIELGGLVQKAGLVELTNDDRATLLGALLELADRLQAQNDERQEEAPANLKARWQRRGLRTFDADNAAARLGDAGVLLNHVQFENRSLSWVEVDGDDRRPPKAPTMSLKLDVV